MNTLDTRRGFTLLEMVLSLAIASVLAVAVTSAIYIVTHSMPEQGDAMSTSAEMMSVDDVLRTELELATRVTRLDTRSIEFEVPDRDADDIDERVEIAWSGTQGAPILQRVNSGTWQPLVTEVKQLQLSATGSSRPVFNGTVTPVPTSASINGRFENGGWSPIYPGNRRGFEIDPSVPSGHVWRLTGVSFHLKWDDGKSTEVLEVSAGPDVTSTSHAWKHSVREIRGGDVASGGEWYSVPLRSPWLDRSEDLIVQLYNKTGSTTPTIRLKSLTAMPPGITLLLEVFGNWTFSALTAVSIEVRYETMPLPVTESSTATIDTVTFDTDFQPGIADAVLKVRPVARVEDAR